jgi:serine/threonine-protein kinase
MAADSKEGRLSELVVAWVERRERGEHVPAEALCPDDPGLAAELRRRIEELGGTGSLMSTPGPITFPAVPGSTDDGAVTATPSEAACDPLFAACSSRYRDLRFHAQGGLGTVYLGHADDLNRDVALKFVKSDLASDPNVRRRFLREAEVTGRLEHPGIVPVYAVGEDGHGHPCYTMRFIRGRTLEDAILDLHAPAPGGVPSSSGRSERLTGLRSLVRRFISVCYTIAYAHSRGVLHRDIKPRNIMLGPYDETLVVDWGLAKVLGQEDGLQAAEASGEGRIGPLSGGGSMVPTEGILGTPQFMSPEQFEGDSERIGPASDIYSLGATLYLILTGRHPFRGRDLLAVRKLVTSGEFPRPRSVARDVPRALEAICLKAMALQPSDRYAGAQDMAADLERWLADEPVSAWREPLTIRARRWLSRHRTLVISGAAAAFVALAGSAVIALIQVQANRELRAANARESRARRQAVDRFDLALEAIETYHCGAGRDALLKQPEFQDLRKNLLQPPLLFYRKLTELLEADETADATSRAGLARAYGDLASLSDSLGSKEDAGKAYDRALDLRESLARAEPRNLAYTREAAKVRSQLAAWLRSQGRHEEALRSYQQAADSQESLFREHPEDIALRRDLGGTYADRGVVLREMGKPGEALRDHERALEVRTRLSEEDPRNVSKRIDLAKSLMNMGVLHTYGGRQAEALESYEQALAVQKALRADAPDDDQVKHELAMTHNNIGIVNEAIGRWAEALTAYGEAGVLFEELARARPAVVKYQNEVAAVHNNRGLLLAKARPDEAREEYHRALEIRQRLVHDHPSVVEYRLDFAATQVNLGVLETETRHHEPAVAAHRAALAIFERLVKEHRSVVEFRYYLGGTLSNLAESELGLNRPADAAARCLRAGEILSQFVTEFPSEPAYRSTLGTALVNRGLALDALGRKEEALGELRRGIEQERIALERAPAVAEYRRLLSKHYGELAQVLLGLGRCQEAFDTILLRQQLWPRDPSELYKAARDFCACMGPGQTAQGDAAFHTRCADGAIGALRRAIESGFRDATELQSDAALEAIRPRREFQELVADARFPNEPFPAK